MPDLWSAEISRVADQFLRTIPLDEASRCRQVIREDLCKNPDRYSPLESFPNLPGTIERSLKGWHFRYSIKDSNTILVHTIYFSHDNPYNPVRDALVELDFLQGPPNVY